MTSLPRSAFKACQRPLLSCASLLVPASRRADWQREWRAELWHVRQACVPAGELSWQAECSVACFCLGAFPDAVCLRRQFGERPRPLAPLAGSPAQCLACLAAVLAACFFVSLLLPGVRAERSLAWSRAYAGVVMIRSAQSSSDAAATISPRQFERWAAGKGKYFDGFAFFRVARQPVAFAASRPMQWQIADATPNLFALLGVPVRALPQDQAHDHLPGIVLSDNAWRRDFGGNPQMPGALLRIGGRNFRVAGIVPRGSWRFPQYVDAWLLEPGSAFRSGSPGYVVAQLSAKGEAAMWAPRQIIKAYGPHNSEEDLLGVSLDDKAPPPWAVFLFGVFLALLALPATASVSRSEYSLLSHKPSRSKRVRRWSFLAGKIALLLPIAYFASLDFAYAYATLFSPYSVYLLLASSFLICLGGLSWASRDQRQRCPVCLRRVTHPAQVGAASQSFLGWSGTELICAGGHTMLHIPALPTSWFSTQRWLYLDGSWDFLFAGS